MVRSRRKILNERRIVTILADKLRDRNERLGKSHEQYLGEVFSHVTPAKSSKLYAILKEVHGGLAPPLQPDIDILFRNNDDTRAVEVKVFHLETSGRLSRSYYEGIDQALALLMLGFDRVALWHVFDQDIGLKRFTSYGSSLQIFIRNQLKLPIDFTAMYLTGDSEDIGFVPTQPWVRDRQTMELVHTRLLRKIDDPLFPFVWQTCNPLLVYPLVVKIRTAMLEWLETRAKKQ